LDAQGLFLLLQFGAECFADVLRSEYLTDFNLGLAVKGGTA